jgi:hypothetical protein
LGKIADENLLLMINSVIFHLIAVKGQPVAAERRRAQPALIWGLKTPSLGTSYPPMMVRETHENLFPGAGAERSSSFLRNGRQENP